MPVNDDMTAGNLEKPEGPASPSAGPDESVAERAEALRGTDITARRESDEALRLSEERFSKAFNYSPNAITITRLRDGMIIEGNESAYEMLGYGHDEVVGKTTYALNIWADTADRDRLVRELLSSGSVRNREFVLLAKGGRPLVVDLSASLITIAGDQCFLTSFIDITERKQAEQQMRRDLDAMTRLQKLGTLSAREGNLEPVLKEIVDAAIAISGADFGNIQLLDPAGGDLRLVAQRGFEPWWLEFWNSVAKGTGCCGTALERGERVIIEDLEQSPIFAGTPALDIQRKAGVRAVQSTPLIGRSGKPVGMFSTHYRSPRRPDERELRLLDLLARQAADIIEHVQAEAVLRESLTERERTQKELLSRENLLSALTDNSPDAIYVKDTESCWLMANPAVLRIVGKSAEEALGKTDLELYADPEIGRAILENDRRLLEERKAETFEEFADTPDGRRLFLSTKAPWFDAKGDVGGLIGISHDITQSKKAEELRQALAEQENLRLGAAVEQASDAVIMIDLDGTIRYVNAAFESINGIVRQEAAGTSYFDLLAGEPAGAAAIREAVAGGRPWHGPLTRSFRDARPVELEVTVFPAKDLSGAVIGGLITEKEVTRENALQNQVRQAQKMEALGTLAGGITHDFNNILGTIILNTELALLDLDLMNPARRSLPLVLQAANRGRELVKQIITFSRQRTWEKKPVEIAPIITEGMRFLRTALPKDISILETIDSGSGIVLADPSHINQVLANLCQNAALAMREGGGRLAVTLEPVEVDEPMALRHPNLKPGPFARLSVSDTGCGMTKELQERIFEPFFTTRGPREGSGLGLAVVLGIIRTYDGEITVKSEPGKGSTFEVYFPRLEGEGLTAGVEKHEEPHKGGERVLLVEDEEAQRSSLERGLEGLGYKVTARADGRSAFEAFRKDPSAFDVIVTDQIMPRMTGLELASEITALRPDLPVILCTGFSERVSEENVGKSGVRELLMKPFSFLEATRLIRKVLP